MRHGILFLSFSRIQALRPLFLLALVLAVWMVAPASRAQDPWVKVAPNVIDDIGFKGKSVVLVQVAPSVKDVAGAALPLSQVAIRNAQQSVLKRLNGGAWTLRHRFDTIPYLTLEVDENALERLVKMNDVGSVELDHEVHGALAESVPAIGADWVHDHLGEDGNGVTVGIIDTGIDTDNPDLTGAVVAGQRFLNQGQDVGTDIEDDNGHGTHTAGIITSDGIDAPLGVAPGATLVVIKALDNTNSGWVSDLISGIDWIIANHDSFPTLKFINLSLVASDPTGLCPCDTLSGFSALKAAMDRAQAAGIIVIAATGNDGDSSQISAPACFSNVIAVGAFYDTDFFRAPETGTFSIGDSPYADCFDADAKRYQIACFTNRNACLDFLAPGYLITSSRIGGGFEFQYGTSQAVPHVVGTLALLQAHDKYNLSASELVDILRDSAPLDPSSTYLRIDARAALESLNVSNLVIDWTIYH